MLCLQDCLEYVRLSDAEIDAIVEHERVPAIVAAELGNFLMTTPAGVPVLRRMLVEDIEHAVARGDRVHAGELRGVLSRFDCAHPEPGCGVCV